MLKKNGAISLVLLFFGLAFSNRNNLFFYQVLEIHFSASDEEIKQAYSSLSNKYHPEKSGYSDKFAKIQRAYQVLSNRIKKHIYDTDGLDEVESYEQAVAHGYSGQRYRKPQELVFTINIYLEEAYIGGEKNIAISRKSLCRKCHATGAKNGELKHCHHCQGKGVVIQNVQTQMGFVMQMQTTCPKCGGRGHMSHEHCPICNGSKMISENKNFKLTLEKGVKHGEEFFFEGEGDAYTNALPGDVKFVIHIIPHHMFERKEDDLYIKLAITFKEAIFGFSKTIRHLDGRAVEISKSEPSQPFSFVVIKGEGMQKKNSASEKGDLYLELILEFPRHITEDQRNILKTILG